MKRTKGVNDNRTYRQSLLIVDDDKDWTDLLRLYFLEKYEVQVVNSACEAMEVIRKEQPSVIILDLVMPMVDGFGIIRRLNDSSHARIPTILVTGWNTAEVEECATAVGCAAVLSKPIELDELDAAVSFVMSRKTVRAKAVA
ncbi:MAG TPA: response regulator [Blastocatellia bacterium]|nr:response regulator [Blastocatellia bacterium]